MINNTEVALRENVGRDTGARLNFMRKDLNRVEDIRETPASVARLARDAISLITAARLCPTCADTSNINFRIINSRA